MLKKLLLIVMGIVFGCVASGGVYFLLLEKYIEGYLFLACSVILMAIFALLMPAGSDTKQKKIKYDKASVNKRTLMKLTNVNIRFTEESEQGVFESNIIAPGGLWGTQSALYFVQNEEIIDKVGIHNIENVSVKEHNNGCDVILRCQGDYNGTKQRIYTLNDLPKLKWQYLSKFMNKYVVNEI